MIDINIDEQAVRNLLQNENYCAHCDNNDDNGVVAVGKDKDALEENCYKKNQMQKSFGVSAIDLKLDLESNIETIEDDLAIDTLLKLKNNK